MKDEFEDKEYVIEKEGGFIEKVKNAFFGKEEGEIEEVKL